MVDFTKIRVTLPKSNSYHKCFLYKYRYTYNITQLTKKSQSPGTENLHHLGVQKSQKTAKYNKSLKNSERTKLNSIKIIVSNHHCHSTIMFSKFRNS